MIRPQHALTCPLLLTCATAIGLLSLSAPIWLARMFTLVFARGSVSTTASFLPFVLGGASMLLCLRARQRAQRKRLVLVYAVVLAPFAFSYPAWILFLFVLYVSGRYTGPMP
ncbi:MAG: hypothetical protein ABSF98_25345 [Bryobacteraceae bacterium]